MSGQYPNTFYRVTVKALIKNNKGEVLLVKEKSDRWDLPGGGLNHGEEPEDGIKRELLEELGVNNTTIGKSIIVKSFWREDKQAWLMWIVCEAFINNNRFKPGEGVTAINYLNPATLANSEDMHEQFISHIATIE